MSEAIESEGTQREIVLRAAGFGDAAVGQWKAESYQALTEQFGEDEAKKYFGMREPDMAPMEQYVQKNMSGWRPPMALPSADGAPGKPVPENDSHYAKTALEAFEAGLQVSVSGLDVRGKLPNITLAESAPMYQRVMEQVGTFVGDIPAMGMGMIVGGGAGATAGPVGAGLGTMAGGFSLPTYMREYMMDQYRQGGFRNPGDYLERMLPIIKKTMDSAATGVVTGAVGGKVGEMLGRSALTPTAQAVGKVAAEVGAMTTTASGLEGHLPSFDNFIDASVFMLGLHGVSRGFRNATELYKATGKDPLEAATEGKTDPHVQQQIGAPENDGTAKLMMADAGMPVDADYKSVDGHMVKFTAEEASAKVGESIVTKVEKPKEPVSADKLIYEIEDGFHFIGKAQKEIYGDKTVLPDELDAHMLARLSNRSRPLSQYMYEFGPVDFKTGEATGDPGVREIIEPFRKSGLEGVDRVKELDRYRVAKRALELEARGINSGVDVEAAKVLVESGKAEFDKAATDLTRFNNMLLKYAKDSGLMSEQSFDAIMKSGDAYTFFSRVIPETGEKLSGISKKDPFKKIKGSSAKIETPIASEIRRMRSIIRLAERQRVTNAIAELANADKEGKWLEEIKERKEALTGEELMTALDEADTEIKNEDNPTKKQLAQSRENPIVQKDGTLMIVKDGEKRYYKVRPELLDSIKELDDNFQMNNALARSTIAVTKWIRGGIINSPLYPLSNFIKDQPTAGIYSKYGYRPFLDSFGGFMDIVKESDSFKEYMKSGASTSSLWDISEKYFDESGNFNFDPTVNQQAWNLVKTPLDLFKFINMGLEHGTRIAEFKAARKAGASSAKAAMAAREVTLDFSKKGSADSIKAMRQLVPFFGSNINAVAKFGREMTNKETGPATAAKALGMIMLPSAALYLYNKDDPMYEHLEQWKKDLNWAIPIHKWRPAKPTDEGAPPEFFRDNDGVKEFDEGYVALIPKPQEFGLVFGAAIERTLADFLEKNPGERETLAKAVWSVMTPNLLPPAIGVPLEMATGVNFFTNNPIVPEYLKNELPAERYTPYTSETAKTIGRTLGYIPGLARSDFIAPANIDYLISSWTGGQGKILVDSLETAARKSGMLPDTKPEGDDFFQSKLFRRFVMRYPYSNTQQIKDFRGEAAFIAQEYTSFTNRIKEGDYGRAIEIEQTYGPIVGKLDGMVAAMNNQQRMIKLIERNNQMAPTEKRQQIDMATYMLISTADAGVKFLQERKTMVDSLKREIGGTK